MSVLSVNERHRFAKGPLETVSASEVSGDGTPERPDDDEGQREHDAFECAYMHVHV